MLSSDCAVDFQGGNRLFLFLPPNLHFISFSASSLSLSKPFPSYQHTFFFSPIPLPHPLSTLHRRRDLTSLLTPTQFYRFHILFLVSVLSFPSRELPPPPFLYMQSGPVIIHTAVDRRRVTKPFIVQWMLTEHPKNNHVCIQYRI